MNKEFIESLGFEPHNECYWDNWKEMYYAKDKIRGTWISLTINPSCGAATVYGFTGNFKGIIRCNEDLLTILKMTGIWDEIHPSIEELSKNNNEPLLKYLAGEDYFPIKDNLDLK